MTMATMLTTIAAALLAVPASAQMTAHPATLAPGEVALHIVAHGETSTPADRIVVTTTVTGKGATVADAQTAVAASTARLTAALAAAGIDRGAIVATTPGTGRVVAAPPAIVASAGSAPTAAARPAPMQNASATVTVTVADHGGLDRITRTLAAQGQSVNGKPAASLRDPSPARRTATLAAVARARGDADDYAAALGLRVVRIVAVSNAAGLGDGIEDIADIFERFGNHDVAPDTVVTRATATIDFVLAPR